MPRNVKFIDYQNDYHREVTLMAIAATDDLEQAGNYLKAEHKLISTPTKLNWIRDRFAEQYEELRQKLAPVREQTLAHDLLDNSLYANKVIRTAMAQLEQRLEENKVPAEYLSRVVRDMADVQAKSVDKKLALEGRPTTITENRNAAEIIRALEAKGVLKKVEIEQGEVDGA